MAPVLVALAYYAGAHVGLLLRFPTATPSVVWPPNSILTAALLLTPPRRWWIYLLAAFPAHVLAELPAGWPLALVVGLFVSNCSQALIAAVWMRAFSDAPTRFDTLHRVSVFIVGAGLLAPFASSFLDAGMVALFGRERYWSVFFTRFCANVLTEVALVPAIVTAIASARPVRDAPRARKTEAALLTLGMLATGATFITGGRTAVGADLAFYNPVAWFLPLQFWAAVRFGPVGVSLALLATTLVVITDQVQATTALTIAPGPETILALQITLSISAVPLMCLAAMVEEHRRDQRRLARRLRSERMLARLSGAFVRRASDRMDEIFAAWLRRLARRLGVDRALLLRIADDSNRAHVEHAWESPALPPIPRGIALGDLPWTADRLRREQPVVVATVDDLPPAATADRDWVGRHRIRAMLAIPLVRGGHVFGALVLATSVGGRTWPTALTRRLQLFAAVFANALERKRDEDALRASEVMNSAILGSLNSGVAVLDRTGAIIAMNKKWGEFAPPGELMVGRALQVGESYVAAFHAAIGAGRFGSRDTLAGLEAVLEGRRADFTHEYSWRTLEGERWIVMSVVPLNLPDGGAVVSQMDATERRRAELDAQRNRQELAHVTRVSTMGELAASLAHELNQPLTGILANAQAARRLLAAPSPPLEQLRAILSDIVDDDKRAAEVIQRLRELLRKGPVNLVPLDLNELIRDVIKLLASDVIIRNVTVSLELAEDRAIVSGDRVQLQQVVLNLVLNGMEAMSERGTGARALAVRTRCADGKSVHVSVEDTGPGLRDGSLEVVFEPFYTTKSSGMGMGLAIARSIVEAHGGVIWAESRAPSGAAFRFRLPLLTEDAG